MGWKRKKILANEDMKAEDFFSILQKGSIKLKQVVVEEKSQLDGVLLKKTNLPKNVMIGPLVKGETVILPDGNTRLEKGDLLTLLGTEDDIRDTKAQLEAPTKFSRLIQFFKRTKRKQNSEPGTTAGQ